MQGRKTPYTIAGIKRCKCIRCGKPAYATWAVCADDNLYRPICKACDIELNELVLKWAGFPDWELKLTKYKESIGEGV